MRDDSIGYVVCEISQASGQVTDTLPSQVLHSDRADAEFERDLHADETAEAGRTGDHRCPLVDRRTMID